MHTSDCDVHLVTVISAWSAVCVRRSSGHRGSARSHFHAGESTRRYLRPFPDRRTGGTARDGRI